MLVFPHRRAIRRSVLVTLAVWVFVLMAGFANACLLHDGQPRHLAQVQAAEHDAHDATCNDAWDGAALWSSKWATTAPVWMLRPFMPLPVARRACRSLRWNRRSRLGCMYTDRRTPFGSCA